MKEDIKTYLQILDLPDDATISEIRRKYHQLAKELHPDLNPDKDTDDDFRAVTEAYRKLLKYFQDGINEGFATEEETRREHINFKVLAKRYYAKGVLFFKQGDINNALYMFEEAFRRDEKNEYKKWIAKCLMNKERRLFDAKDLCNELIQSEPWNPEYYAMLGDIYHKKGIYKIANEYYKKAIDMGFPEEKLAGKLTVEKKGFLKRLFKKA